MTTGSCNTRVSACQTLAEGEKLYSPLYSVYILIADRVWACGTHHDEKCDDKKGSKCQLSLPNTSIFMQSFDHFWVLAFKNLGEKKARGQGRSPGGVITSKLQKTNAKAKIFRWLRRKSEEFWRSLVQKERVQSVSGWLLQYWKRSTEAQETGG
jgi:hypothetical protein